MTNAYRQRAGKARFKKTKIGFDSNTRLYVRKEKEYTDPIGVEFGNLNSPPPKGGGNINASGSAFFQRYDPRYPALTAAFCISVCKGYTTIPHESRSCLLDINLYIGRDPSEEDHLPWLGAGNSLVLEITSKIGEYKEEVVIYSYKYESPLPEDNTSAQIIGPYNFNRSRVLIRDYETAGHNSGGFTVYAKITGDESKQTGDVYVLEEGSYVTLEALPPVITDAY